MSDPTEFLPDTPEEDVTREQLLNAYKASDPPTEQWENFGDVTPEHHGGAWCVFKPEHDEWEIVVTTPAAEVHHDAPGLKYDDPGEQYIQSAEVDFEEVVTEDGAWTDNAQQVIESLHKAHRRPDGMIVDGKLTSFIAAFIQSAPNSALLEQINGNDSSDLEGVVQLDDYEAVLEYMGVDPAEQG